MNHGHMLHIPGQLSRRGVIDVGLKCPHSCQHCFTREPGRAAEGKDFERNHKSPWRPTDQLIRQVEAMKENGFVAVDFTGGEPTLHPGIVEIVAACTRVGLASRIITLGQALGKGKLTSLMAAGLTDFRFSYHAADEDIFHAMTGGSLAKLQAAMDALDTAEFQYYTNTTITTANYRHLPALARDMAKSQIYGATFLHMMSHYAHADSADQGLRARYSAVAPYLREAVDILEAAGIAVTVRYAPLCTMAGLERNMAGQVAVRHDPHEWMNAVEHSGEGDADREAQFLCEEAGKPASHAQLLASVQGGPPIGRGTVAGPTKLFAGICQACSAMEVCDGIDPGYLDAHGEDEFRPYANINRGHALDRERLSYLAGHVVKLAPDGNPKAAVKRLLNPEPLPAMPRVSVVVPNYNHAKEIGKCLASLAAQTYPDVEVIVVDDGSTDDSVAVIRGEVEGGSPSDSFAKTSHTTWRYGKPFNFTLIRRHDASGGPATPRNDGIRASTGDLVMCLDPDDYLAPSYIEECVRALKKNPWASIAYTGLQTFGMEEVQWVTAPFDMGREIEGNFIPTMALYRRSMWDDIGGYDESPDVRGVEDYNFWVSAVRLGHLGVPVPRQLAFYCRSASGLFEAEVKPNFAAKTAAVRARNQEVYPVGVALAARAAE